MQIPFDMVNELRMGAGSQSMGNASQSQLDAPTTSIATQKWVTRVCAIRAAAAAAELCCVLKGHEMIAIQSARTITAMLNVVPNEFPLEAAM